MNSSRHPQKGSLILVVLCFVAVLGIGLAGYLAVSSQSMKLSNRSYVKEVSGQLAEMGLEEALRALNANNFSSWTSGVSPNQTTTTWTVSGTTASATIILPAAAYGNPGVAGSAKIRVDHSNAAPWNAATSYTTSDMVWARGIWFQCKTANVNQVPPNANWTSAPAPWSPIANYNVNDLALFGGHAFRCVLIHANQVPPNATYWASGVAVAPWNSATTYAVDNVALLGGTAFRCILGNTNQSPPNATYWVSAPVIYAEGVASLPDIGTTTIKTQLRATPVPAALFPNAVAATATLVFSDSSSSGLVDSYNSVLDPTASTRGFSAVLAGGTTASTAVTVTGGTVQGYLAAPSAATTPFAPLYATGAGVIVKGTTAGTGVDLSRISRSPSIPQFEVAAWDSAKGYRLNDVVRSGTDLYLCKLANTGVPTSNLTYWTPNSSVALVNPGAITLNSTTPTKIFYSADVILDTGDTITIAGPVILDIRGQLYIRNGGQIIITSTGSAEILISDRFSVGSTGTPASVGIDNQTKDPKKLLLVDTVGFTSFPNRNNSSAPFYGTIFMPNNTSALDLKSEFYGAVSAQSVNFSLAANFHYDTSLRTATFRALDAPFALAEWRELTDPAEKVVLP